MPTAVLLSPFSASPLGHGGNHRAYQIVDDLRRAVGGDEVRVMVVATAGDPGTAAPPGLRALYRMIGKIARKIGLAAENPISLVARNRFYSRCFDDAARSRSLSGLLADARPPVLCVVEHAGLVDMAKAVGGRRVTVVACPANLESLETGGADLAGRRASWATGVDLANELRALARADHRLCISKVETAVLQGLGVRAHTYPYLPVGEIRDALVAIRRARQAGSIDPSLLVVLGSAHHASAGAAMEWLLGELNGERGLASVRIVAAGAGTERFAGRWRNVEALGWVDQDELAGLLSSCAAVLAPQRTGFGALTRLAELACAGVPVLVSTHALAALDPPPGARPVEDSSDAWRAAIRAATATAEIVDERAWATWEARQPRALQALAKRLADMPVGHRAGGARVDG